MANGSTDVLLTADLDISKAIATASKIPSLVKPIKLNVDTSGFSSARREVDLFSKSLQQSNARILSFAISGTALFGVIKGLVAIKNATIDVQKELTNINSIFSLSTGQLSKFSNDLFKVANLTGQSFKTAADAALIFSRQGLSVEQTLIRTKDALTLTRLTGLDVADSIKTITVALNAFNDITLDSTKLVNKLNLVESQFAIQGKDLAQALTRIGSVASDSGVEFSKLVGLITAAKVVTQREGGQIATAIGTIFQKLQRPEALEQLKQLGIITEDYSGKALSSDKILTNLAKSYNTLSDAQKSNIAQLAGGIRNGNILKGLLQDLSKENSIYSRVTKAAASDSDSAIRRQLELNKTLSSSVNQTINDLTNAASKVGNLTLAPAIENVLKIINGGLKAGGGDEGETAGQSIGEGVLKGIGNYIAGPGLALGAVIIGKLFANFGSFAADSLSKIIEGQSIRNSNEAAYTALLNETPGLKERILQLDGQDAEIQQLLIRTQVQKLAALNEEVALREIIAKQTVSAGSLGLFQQERLLKVSGSGEGSSIGLNSGAFKANGLIPSLTESLGALKGGYKAGEIKQLNIPKIGNVIYNSAETVKNFPGLSQPAIIPPQYSKAGQNYSKSFQSKLGFNPYKADGFIPYPYNLLPSSILNTLPKEPKFDITSLVPDSVKYGNIPNQFLQNQSSAKLLGNGTGRNAIQLPDSPLDVGQELRDLYKKIFVDIPNAAITKESQTPIPFVKRNKEEAQKRLIEANQKAFLESGITDEQISKNSFLAGVNPKFFGQTKSQLQNIQDDRNSFIISNSHGPNLPDGPSREIFDGLNAIERIKQSEIQSQLRARLQPTLDFTKETSKLGPLDLILGSLPNSKYKNLQNRAQNEEQQGVFNRAKDSAQNKALLASFILPILGGLGEQGVKSVFGDNSPTSRGAGKTVSGIANITSFAATGAGIAGPYGALGGAAIGLATELPSIFKAFTDTLPDLEKQLDKLKETSQRTSSGLNQFIDASTKLLEIQDGQIKATNGQRFGLQRQQAIGLANAPEAIKGDLRKAYNNRDIGAIADISSQQQENDNAIQNNAASLSLLKKNFFPNIPAELPDFNPSKLELEQIGGLRQRKVSIDKLKSDRQDKINEGIQPIIESNVLNAPTKSGTLFDTFNKLDSGVRDRIVKTLSDKTDDKSLDTFGKILESTKEIDPKLISSITDLLKGIRAGTGNNNGIVNALSNKTFNERNQDNKEVLNNSITYAKKLNDINEQLNKLAINGAAAATKFEVGVLSKFNNAVTAINVGSLVKTGQRNITQLQGGNNDFLKSYLDFQGRQQSASDTFNRSNLDLDKNTSLTIGNTLVDIVEKIPEKIKTQLDKISKGGDTSVESQRISKIFSDVYKDFIKVGSNNSVSLQKDFNSKNLDSFINSTSGQISQLAKGQQIPDSLLAGSINALGKNPNAKFSDLLGTVPSNSADVNNIRDAYSNLPPELQNFLKDKNITQLQTLIDGKSVDKESIEDLRKLLDTGLKLRKSNTVQSENIRGNFDNSTQENLQEFNNSNSFISAKFSDEQERQDYLNSLDVGVIGERGQLKRGGQGLIRQQGGLERQRLTADSGDIPDINNQLRRVVFQSQTLSKLADSSINLNNVGEIPSEIKNQTNQINGLNNFVGPLSEGQGQQLNTLKGQLQALLEAKQKLTNEELKSKATEEEEIKNDKLRLALNQDIVAAKKTQNENLIRSGTPEDIAKLTSGANVRDTFLQPLQYSQKDLFNDTFNNIQQVGTDLKDAFKGGFAEAEKGTQSFGKSMEQALIGLGQKLQGKLTDTAVNEVFGLFTNGFGNNKSTGLGSLFSSLPSTLGGSSTSDNLDEGATLRAKGGYIPKFSKGGFVNMGSGTKDDVPAYLSGGEFVLNKKAVQAIGTQNLDVLNGGKINPSGAITKDNVNIDPTSATIQLANTYEFGGDDKNFRGKANVSPLLSSYALDDENNPQNKLRFSREKYVVDRQQFENQKDLAAKQYEKAKSTGLIIGLASAAIHGAVAGAGSAGGDDFSSGDNGQGGPGGNNPGNQGGTDEGGYSDSNYGLGAVGGRAKGGYIPKFSRGGHFGGDSSNDRFGAMVMGGEYIVSPQTVSKKGVSYFQNLNKLGNYSAGGYTGGGSSDSNNLNDTLAKLIDINQQISDKLGATSSTSSKNTPANSNSQPTSNAPIFNVSTVINVASNGTTTSSTTATNSGGTNDKGSTSTSKENLTALSKLVESKVIEVITTQSKAGGLLSEKFAARK